MLLEPGKLFKINEYFWLLFPTKETAAAAPTSTPAPAASVTHAAAGASWASYWSKELNCNVSFMSKGDILMVVEVSGDQVQTINQEGKSGWINFPVVDAWTKGTITEISNDI